jgi:hypothetical protein
MEILQVIGLLVLISLSFTALGTIIVILAITPIKPCGYRPATQGRNGSG